MKYLNAASPFEGLDMEPWLASEFFATFARFEFALKESGFLSKDSERAKADWTEFAKQISSEFDPSRDQCVQDAVAFLIANPPQVQFAVNRRVVWDKRPLKGDCDAERVIDCVQRIRNNLFHGGKHSPHSPRGHDELLVKSALAVLGACLNLHSSLRLDFEQHRF